MTISLVVIALMVVMYACGTYLMLERSMTRVLLGFLLVGNATNLLILSMSGGFGVAPIVADGVEAEDMSDPLPQALILTAIVITFGVSAFLMALIYRSWRMAREDVVQDDAEDIAVGTRETTAEEEPDESTVSDTEFEDEAAAAASAAAADSASEVRG
ncbi:MULTISPECIES: Na(+)/H(+) antiporter subunit C [unclassified Diaminobutyricimonas]|uniref:Na(+)/H(+) antiporter subunit C n=1 Tax=unclassified Diaminobutyricimonas TaxID=2643261 RepID=UPI0012F47EB7|nr:MULTISPECIES: Na(+)/H(+) antiporter subunit C [unclassified Diaminobutyricimonas]